MSGDLSNPALNVSDMKQEQTLQNIQQLQSMEKNLYAQLESVSADSGDAATQNKLVKRINELSEMRISLFKTLSDMYDSLQNSVAETRVDLVDQMTVVGIVENELNHAKANLNSLESAKNNKMRMVEINTYYGQRYQAHTGVMKLIIMITVPLLILAILNKKGLIPSNIANGLTTLILIVSAILFIRRIMDLSSRDNMNYDEIDWKFNPDAISPTVYEYDKQQLTGTQIESDVQNAAQNLATNIGLGCIGASCCSKDMTYNHSTNKCVENTTSTQEGFQVQQSNDTSYVVTNDNVCPWGKNSTVIKSFSPSSDNYASV